MSAQDSPSRWERLEAILLTLKADDAVTVDAIVAETGLSPEMVQAVLNGLVKAELFERRGDVFVRRSLFRDFLIGPAFGHPVQSRRLPA
jgi:DeoR/GlpR family transcriptional regulator of sugar metabolism